ncbi:MAG: hypothetical protein A2V66_18110 [Ignavibacteria bacterium RBG_13_36_8]|nr:MAG: hypothetical protein A2V66_18110 [Ignavibacteria bacterium RBG_13_36_8]
MNKLSQNYSRKYISEGALLLMTIIWGGTFVIVKESLPDISSMLFVAFRFGIASLVLLVVLIKMKKVFSADSIKAGIFLGVILFLGFATQTVGLKYTSATKSGFITGSLVVMVPIFQTIIFKKAPTKGALLGTILVFIGILFLSSGEGSIWNLLGELGRNFNFGDFLTLVCAVFFALHVVYIGIISPKYDFLELVFLQITTASVLSFIASFVFSSLTVEPLHVELTGNLILGLLYTSLLATLLNLGLQTRFQKEVSPTNAGIIYSFEPIFAAIFAFFVLSEKITNFGFIGCALIFSGLLVSELYDNLTKQNGSERIPG